jgi:predicted amidohydrolase YtcJ
VGNEEGGRKFARGGEVIDLKGAIVLPGLIDAHAHLLSLGKYQDELKLKLTKSPAEVKALVMSKISSSQADDWIIGRGWDHTDWPGKQFPSWRDLQGTETNPVYLTRVDGHTVWVNKRALEICGINRDTPDSIGGKILRSENGEPSGILLDNAIDLVRDKIPKPSKEVNRRRMMRAMEICAQNGLTGVGDAGVDSETVTLYQELLTDSQITVRVYGILWLNDALLKKYYAEGPLIDQGEGMLTLRSIKLFVDGALGSRGALMLKPYSDDPSTCGIMITGEEEIFQRTLDALKHGFQVCTHAIGDKGNNLTLNAYERALDKVPLGNYRLRVEHCQILSESDIPRFRKFGIIASMQPTHATSDMLWAEERVGQERIKRAYAWRSLLNTKAKLAFGSDFPVEEVNPFLGIYAAVTRQDISGNPEGGWYPEQCLTVKEAVEAFTKVASYAQFQENQKAMIKSGFWADFTIIDRDIFKIPPQGIKDIKVVMTIVGGKVVYKKS